MLAIVIITVVVTVIVYVTESCSEPGEMNKSESDTFLSRDAYSLTVDKGQQRGISTRIKR